MQVISNYITMFLFRYLTFCLSIYHSLFNLFYEVMISINID